MVVLIEELLRVIVRVDIDLGEELQKCVGEEGEEVCNHQ